MAGHPLFDVAVISHFPAVTDELLKHVPDGVTAVDILLRPDASVDVTFPDGAAPENWTTPKGLVDIGESLVAAWKKTGHPMPAFLFSHRRGDDGEWQASSSPREEW